MVCQRIKQGKSINGHNHLASWNCDVNHQANYTAVLHSLATWKVSTNLQFFARFNCFGIIQDNFAHYFNDQQEEECKKFLPFDDVVKLVHQAEAAPDKEGNYHDYVELCKLYDKNENGTMMLAELENILSNLGKFINNSLKLCFLN